MTPYQAIKRYCIDCMGGDTYEVKNCTDTNCQWYNWRSKKQPGSSIKAIRKFCVEECVGLEEYNTYKKVKNCNPNNKCSLHPFREGHNPNITVSDKQKKILASMRFKKGFKKA